MAASFEKKSSGALHIFSPAKINLYLHITGRMDNGYHALDSLVGFVDVGDTITITPADEFCFNVDGPFAKSFHAKELDSSPSSSNIAVKAAWDLSRALQKPLNVCVSLSKNLPLASGIGGGSANAAAVVWGLMEYWDIPKDGDFSQNHLGELLLQLGADVPVCFHCTPARLRGIGEILDPAPLMEETPIVLIHPGKPCNTAQIFAHYLGEFHDAQTLPHDLQRFDDFILFLCNRSNDLYSAACDIVPEIKNIVASLDGYKGCALARMSGSGSTCFGLFEDEVDARNAAKEIAADNPDWWIKCGYLNRPERY